MWAIHTCIGSVYIIGPCDQWLFYYLLLTSYHEWRKYYLHLLGKVLQPRTLILLCPDSLSCILPLIFWGNYKSRIANIETNYFLHNAFLRALLGSSCYLLQSYIRNTFTFHSQRLFPICYLQLFMLSRSTLQSSHFTSPHPFTDFSSIFSVSFLLFTCTVSCIFLLCIFSPFPFLASTLH